MGSGERGRGPDPVGAGGEDLDGGDVAGRAAARSTRRCRRATPRSRRSCRRRGACGRSTTTSSGASTRATTATAPPSTSVTDTVPTGEPSRVRRSVASSPASGRRRRRGRRPRRRAARARATRTAAAAATHRHRRGDGPAPPARPTGRQPRQDPLVEAERRLHAGDGRQEVGDRRRQLVVLAPARRAAQQVGGHRGPPVGVDVAEHEVDDVVAEVGVVRWPDAPFEVPPVSHAVSSVSSSFRGSPAARRRRNPVLMRVFAVPSGTPSRCPISSAVHPPNTASTTARACSGGRPRRRSTTRATSTLAGRLLAGDVGVAVAAERRLQQPVEVLVVGRRAAPGPHGVDGDVARDRQQPRGDRAAHDVVRRRRPPRPQERLLGDVVGERRIARDGEGEPEHLRLEAPHERRRRVGVLDGQPGDERVVGELGVVRARHVT